MTRINCIPVEELTTKHLIAEYRELPRVFKLARLCVNAPRDYTLGTGHVKFFYDKLLYCYKRQCAIVNEMHRRGYKPTFNPDTLQEFRASKGSLFNDWQPTPEAQRINRERIAIRLRK